MAPHNERLLKKAVAINVALKRMTAKERNSFPTTEFVAYYNKLRDSVLRERHDLHDDIPPAAIPLEIDSAFSGSPKATTYVEIHAYCETIESLLRDSGSKPGRF